MQVSVESCEGLERRVTVELPAEQIEVELRYQTGLNGREGSGFLDKASVGDVEEKYEYYPDDTGNIKERTTSFGTYAKYEYDEWDRPVREVLGMSNSAEYRAVNAQVERAFDAAGHLVRERYYQKDVGWVETQYLYNHREQLVSVTRCALAASNRRQRASTPYRDRVRTAAVPGGVTRRDRDQRAAVA